MSNDYTVQTKEIIEFIDVSNTYLYSSLFRFCEAFNYKWYCALKSKYVSNFIHAYCTGKRQKMKDAGTLPKYDPMNELHEYERLKRDYSDKMPKYVKADGSLNIIDGELMPLNK